MDKITEAPNSDSKEINISIIMPALNEEKNIAMALNNSLMAFEDFNIAGEIIVIDDGSKDNTEAIIREAMNKDGRIRIIVHEATKGFGASFWDGVDKAEGEKIMMLPGDNESDPWEILRYHNLLKEVDIVIPFVFNREVRSPYRNMLSYIYRFIVNTTFLVNFNYTNGTVLYRKSLLKELDYRSSGYFFQTDILIRTVKKGYLFAEVPCRLGIRKEGLSKAITFPSFLKVVKGYLNLVNDRYFYKNKHLNKEFSLDSLTLIRRNKEHKDNNYRRI